MTYVVYWDIDGTLLSTARAGVLALEDAAREVLGTDADLSNLPTSGLTDYEVAAVSIEAAGGEPTPDAVTEFVRVYERRLPDRLPLRRGHVMPGVVEALEALERRPDALSLLLTGNTGAGAGAKLVHYGLDGYFHGGAFSVEGGSRESIARRARAIAAERLGTEPDPECTFVIGDTPHDVRCGKAIGARTVAVATGTHSLEELEASEPWLALEQLPEAPELLRRLGLPTEPGRSRLDHQSLTGGDG